MIHRTRRRTLTALVCLVALVSAACGSAPDGGTPPATTTAAGTTPAPATPSAPTSSPTPSPSSTSGSPAPVPSPSDDPTSPPPAIERVEWAEDLEGGRSLQVFPTAWGRDPRAAEQGWAEVIALEPEADTQVMELQFRCHALGAPEKESWNLEPWRPDVPFHEMLLARCNPT